MRSKAVPRTCNITAAQGKITFKEHHFFLKKKRNGRHMPVTISKNLETQLSICCQIFYQASPALCEFSSWLQVSFFELLFCTLNTLSFIHKWPILQLSSFLSPFLTCRRLWIPSMFFILTTLCTFHSTLWCFCQHNSLKNYGFPREILVVYHIKKMSIPSPNLFDLGPFLTEL